ncbi:MAG: aspartate kinase [bacterium]|nr:aspartate kinase [bacterium]
MIVIKFGGTSVSTKDRISNICEIVSKRVTKKPVVVVSALSGVTDLLILATKPPEQSESLFQRIREIHVDLVKNIWKEDAAASKIISYVDSTLEEAKKVSSKGNLDKSSTDKLSSFGEIMSSYIVNEALKSSGIKSQQVLATELIVTDNNFGEAEFLPGETRKAVNKNLKPLIEKGLIPVVTGFIGSTQDGKTTTLGRGGSDYSASIIGYCLNADELEIWTDVDGILTADPKLVKTAKLLDRISYKEASELATFGARVLHPRSIRPAVKAGIPVRILNSFNLQSKGTSILEKHQSKNHITAISSKTKVTLVNIYSTEMLLSKGFLARIFEVFTRHNISVDLVSVSEVSVSVTLDNKDSMASVVEELSEFASVNTSEGFGMVSLIGEGVVASSKNISRIFDILDKEGILVKMVSLGSTDINVSLIIRREQIEKAVVVLHDQILLNNSNYIGVKK